MELTRTQIAKLCALPRADRELLHRRLGASLAADTYGLNDMADVLLSLTGTDVRKKGREHTLTRARSVFCFTCMERGLTGMETARFMGQSHSTVIYHTRKMQEAFALPSLYPDFIQLYNQFKKAIL